MCPQHFRYRKSFIKPPAGGNLFFSSAFFEGGGGLVLFSEMYQREQGFSRTDLWLSGAILLFLTIRKW